MASEPSATIATPKKATKPPTSWQAQFIAALRDNGNVADACRRAKVDRSTAYRERHRSKTFAALWEDALEDAVDELERIANWRARMTSDTLLIFLLKAHRPDKYRETININITQLVEQTAAEMGVQPQDLLAEFEAMVKR